MATVDLSNETRELDEKSIKGRILSGDSDKIFSALSERMAVLNPDVFNTASNFVFNGGEGISLFESSENKSINRKLVGEIAKTLQFKRVSGELSTYITKENADKKGNKPAAGTAKEAVRYMKEELGMNYEQVLEVLARSGEHMVITAHPTSVLNLERIKAHRNGKQGILAQSSGQKTIPDDLMVALVDKYINNLDEQPLVKQKQTVKDEVETALYHLGNKYNAIEDTYNADHNALFTYFPNEHDPSRLKKNIKVGTWVGFDKDGNLNVDEETTIDTFHRHNKEARRQFRGSLNKIKSRTDDPKGYIKALKDHILIYEDTFKGESSSSQRQVEFVDIDLIQETLTAMLTDSDYLGAHDSIRIFSNQLEAVGPSLGKGEYRENSVYLMESMDFILDVAGVPLTNYKTEDDKQELFLDILEGRRPDIQLSKHIADYLDKSEAEIFQEGLGLKIEQFRKFQTTFGRLEIALLNPEGINHHVIAEATENYQVLALEVMKKAVQAKLQDDSDIVKPVTNFSLLTVPLYESPEDMELAPERIDALLSLPYYKELLEDQRNYFSFKEKMQEVMVAMSDNMRRASSLGSRLNSHRALKKMEAVLEKHGIEFQPYIGGSTTDVMRDGGKSMGFKAILYKFLKPVMKFTCQGIDAVHNVNGPATGPMGECNSAAMAKMAAKLVYGPKNIVNENLENQINEVLYKAIDPVVHDYQDNFFGKDRDSAQAQVTNETLKKLDYSFIKFSGNKSSRAGDRVGGDVNIHDTRTISFSKTCQHNGLFLKFLEGGVFDKTLRAEIDRLIETNDQSELGLCLQVLKQEHNGEEFYAKAQNFMFSKSPLMRDSMDRVGCSIANTNFDIVWQSMFNESVPSQSELNNIIENKEDPRYQAAWMLKEYKESAKVSYAAQTGEVLDVDNMDHREIRQEMLSTCYPHFKEYASYVDNTFPTLIKTRKILEQRIENVKNTIDEAGGNLADSEEYSDLVDQAAEIHALTDAILCAMPDETKYELAWEKFLNSEKNQDFKDRIDTLKKNNESVIEKADLENSSNNILNFVRNAKEQLAGTLR